MNREFVKLIETFAVGDNPDIVSDAGVVEHLFEQSDDGLEAILLDDPLADVTLSGAGAAGEERRACEDNGKARRLCSDFRPRNISDANERAPFSE